MSLLLLALLQGALRALLPLTLALGLTVGCCGTVLAAPGPGAPAAAWLESRLAAWPAWQLPAPLAHPGQADLIYPAWFEGSWQARIHDLSGQEPDLAVTVRFGPDPAGAVVGDRAFNAGAIGRALLGENGLNVQQDPRNPNRQLARLAGNRQLESSVIGRRVALPTPDTFLADELSLQVLHGAGKTGGPGTPRVSRVETLSRYRLLGPGSIVAEQWQASYGSPAEGLIAAARRPWHGTLVLKRETAAPLPRSGQAAADREGG